MSSATFVPLLFALAIGLLPVWLLRRVRGPHPHADSVASQPARPRLVRNASIAYALRMAAFAPLFVWGATGDLWPAIVAAVFLAAGVGLLYLVRAPVLDFVERGALKGDRSVSVHAFVAQRHGNDPRVRLLAASLTMFALLVVAAGEVFVVAAFVGPIVSSNGAMLASLVVALLLLAALHALPAGYAGVIHSGQLQLGMLYLGVFGTTALLLYLHASALAPMPAHGTIAVAFLAACSVIVLAYRRSRYVDTGPIVAAVPGGGTGRAGFASRVLTRFGKIINVLISLLLVIVAAVAVMRLYAAGLPAIVRDARAAFGNVPRMPVAGLVAVGLVLLLYPLVDAASWQRLAEARAGAAVDSDPHRRELRGVFGICAIEAGLIALWFCMLGAVAVAGTNAGGNGNPLQRFVAQLVGDDTAYGVVALSLLLACVYALALSTMSAVVSAIMYTVRHDVVTQHDNVPRQRGIVAVALAAAAACLAIATLARVDVTSSAFVALLATLCCAQLALAPLVLGPMLGRSRAATVSGGWALVVVAAGAACGTAALVVYVVSGSESALWYSVPGCIAAGFVLYVIGCVQARRSA